MKYFSAAIIPKKQGNLFYQQGVRALPVAMDGLFILLFNILIRVTQLCCYSNEIINLVVPELL